MGGCCVYVKYLRWQMYASGERVYFALVNFQGRNRVARKKFGKASEAMLYGRALADRASRLLGGAGD